MAKRTSESYSDKTVDMADQLKANGESPELPERYAGEGIATRREHVWRYLSKRVPQTVMAKLLGVSRRTISADVKYWKQQCGDQVNEMKQDPAAANMDIGLTALRLDGIAQAALSNYAIAPTAQMKNLFLNTAIKAETARSTLLMHTGILPKSGEDVRVTHRLKATFSDKLGTDHPLAALDDAQSRRRVIAVAEQLLKMGGDSPMKQIDAKIIDVAPSN